MLNYQPSADDDYSAEVISLARERSPEIDSWFVEQRYLNEAVEDCLNPLWFRNRCIIMICEELEKMGIVVNKNFDDVCDDPGMVYTVLMLRAKFDHDKLKDLLKSHRDLFDIMYAESDEEMFERLIEWTQDVLPLDEGWQLISDTLDDNPGIFDVNAEFVRNMRTVIEEIDSLGEPDVTESVDQELVIKFIDFLMKRQKYVMSVLESIWIMRVDNAAIQNTRRKTMEAVVFGGYEKELGSKSCIEEHALKFSGLDLTDRDAIESFLNEIRAPYLKKWSHCPEFYFGDEKKNLKAVDMVVMFATWMVDYPTAATLQPGILQKIASYEEYLGTDVVKTLTDLFNDTISQHVTLPEINYNETK